MEEVGQRRREEPRPDWQAEGELQDGARPADVPFLEEVAGRTMWWRRSDGGRTGDGGERSDGGGAETGRIGSASQKLFVVTTERGNCSRLLLVCRVFQRKPQGLLNPPPPLCRNHHHLPVSCHMTGSHCGKAGEVGVSDWLSS